MTDSEQNDFFEHPMRKRLSIEVHARPPIRLSAPAQISHLSFLRENHAWEDEVQHLKCLCSDIETPMGSEHDSPYLIVKCEGFTLKLERHGEFSSYTFTTRFPGSSPKDAISQVPRPWLRRIPGKLLSSCDITLLSSTASDTEQQIEHLKLEHENQVVSKIAGNAAWLFGKLGGISGTTKYILIDDSLGELRSGRVLQRLFEIDMYHVIALLGFPKARTRQPFLRNAEVLLSSFTNRMVEADCLDQEHAILTDLTKLASEIENSIAESAYRLGASAAYFGIVEQRVRELKESRVSGYQTLGAFLSRRLAPARNTCAAMARRQEELSSRIARTSQLIRARVDVELQRQNQEILSQMNKRTQLQLRLQETVEGLSVLVLTYYGSQLVKYTAAGLHHWLPISEEQLTALSIPIIGSIVFLATRYLRKRHYSVE